MSNQTQTPPTLLSFIFYFLRKHGFKLALASFFGLSWSLDQAVFPTLFGRVIDAMSKLGDNRADAWLSLGGPVSYALGLWLIIELGFRASGFLLASALPPLEADVRMSMVGYVQRHSPRYFANHFAGNIANKISNMPESLTRLLQLCIHLVIPACGAFIIALGLFFHINTNFALLLGGWLFLHLGTCWYVARKCADLSLVHAESRSDLTGGIVDSLTNYFAVKIFAGDRRELKYIRSYQDVEQVRNYATLIYIEKVKIILGVLSLLGPGIGINWYAIEQWRSGFISLGEVIAIFNTSWNLTFLAWWLGLELPNVFKEIGICQQAFEILKEKPEIVDVPNAKILKVTKGEIRFVKVHFQYPGAEPLFSNKSLKISAGQKVGLVGYSGSGKSTFVNLILRLYDVQKGEIVIDGQNIAEVTQDSLRNAIGMIPQDPTLFHRTLSENISFGIDDVTEEQIVEGSKKGHAHEFIANIPEGYHTTVGERGVRLSGGQRQRVAIARAILKNAPILILDEATSALDSVTETLIQDSLFDFMKDKTTLVVAHRLSTLMHMDRILVFDNGKIVEDGSHDKLLSMGGVYKTLWEAQIGGFLPD